MTISDLKEIIKKVGGLLVMDGEDPSFVVLSYGDYKQLVEGDGDAVAVHKEIPASQQDEVYHQDQNVGIADFYFPTSETQEGLLVNEIEEYGESEESKINRLNQEIALLKGEIKQRETELFTDSLE